MGGEEGLNVDGEEDGEDEGEWDGATLGAWEGASVAGGGEVMLYRKAPKAACVVAQESLQEHTVWPAKSG